MTFPNLSPTWVQGAVADGMLRRTETSGRNSCGATKADEALLDFGVDVFCSSRRSQ